MGKPTILCVDDEVNGLTGRESLLKLNGYEVVISTSGSQSLELLQAMPVDAVVLDYRMPEMTGDVVAARMKQLKPGVPIMLLSAYDRVPEGALHNADRFLSKSAPPDQFVGAVHELVASRSGSFFHRWWQNWRHRISGRQPEPAF